MSEAIFTEVIDVELNSAPLEASLAALIGTYRSALGELNSSGLSTNSLTSGLDLSSISADFSEVIDNLKALTDAFSESFVQIEASSSEAGRTTSTNMRTALNEVDTAVAVSTKTQLENLSQIATGSEEAWSAFAQAAQKALSDDFDPRVRMTADLTNNLYSLIMAGGRDAFEALTAQQQDWFLGFQSALAKVEDALRITATEGTEEWQVQQQKQVSLVEEATRMMQADFKKRSVASEFLDAGSEEYQKSQMKLVAETEEATRLMAADFKKRAEVANSPTIEGTDAWQQAQMRLVDSVEQATRAMEADFKRREQASRFFDASSDAFQQSQMRELASVEEATRLMQAEFKKRADAAEQARKTADVAAKGPSYAKGLDLGAQFSTLAQLQVEWMAINAIINLVVESVKAVGNAFREGYSYLDQLESKAADLQGVLASNVKLSQDQTANFQLSGEAAVLVQQKIEEASVKYGIAVEALDRGFKSFVDSGGASLTRSIGESVDVTILLGAALKASGKDADATRSMLAEFPKLLDGTISSSSKVLETLGLTKVQWMSIRSEAEKHHDLLDQLSPLLQNYVAVAAQAENRHEGVNAQLSLMSSRLEGVLAKDSWDYFLGVLKSIRDYWEAHRVVIEGIARSLGQVVADLVSVVTTFVSVLSQSQALQAVMGLLVISFVAVVSAVDLILVGMSAVTNVVTKMMSLLADPDAWEHPVKAFKELMDYAATQSDRMNASLDKGAKNLGTLMSTPMDGSLERFIKASEDGLMDQPLQAGGKPVQDNTKPTKDALVALKAQYQDLFEANKIAGDKEKEQIAFNLAARKISIEQATQLTIEAANKEYSVQLDLITKTKLAAAGIAAPAASKTSFIGSLNKQEGQLTDSNDKAIAAQKQKEVTDTLKIQDQGYAQMEAAAKKAETEMLAIIRARVKAGEITVVAGLDQELTATKSAHFAIQAILAAEVTQAGANGAMKQAALAKVKAEDDAYTATITANASSRKAALLSELVQYDTVASKQAHDSYIEAEAYAAANQRVSATSLGSATKVLTLAKAYLTVAQGDAIAAAQEVIYARSLGITGKELDLLTEKQLKANAERAKAKQKVETAKKEVIATDPIVPALRESLSDWKSLFQDFQISNKGFTDDLKNFGGDLANTMNSTTLAITEASKIATTMANAIEKGGAQGTAAGLSAFGGGISSISSSVIDATKDGGALVGKLSESMQGLFKNAGVVGQLASAAAGLVSVISSFFTAAAKRIADQIQKAFGATMAAYNNGEATLQATLAAVQSERASAIAQLSGQKGGQAQLDKILPGLDAEIAQLEQQQKAIITNFETSLQKLQMHSTVLASTLDTWNQINASVKAYVDAGGDAAKAAAYLSESLLALKTDAANNLAQGDKDAITAALNYNALLVQRKQLTDAYNKSRFDTLNADALERRASKAVDTGMTQQTADAAYNASLSDLNSQISLAQTEVGMYKQIYQLSSDTAALKAQSNALDIAALATQIQTLKDYQTVYNSIFQKQNGQYGTTNTAGTGAPGSSVAGINVGTFTLNVNTTGGVDGVVLANTIQSELQRSGRYGLGTTFTTY